MSDTLTASVELPLSVFERAVGGDARAFMELAARHYDFAINGHEPVAVAFAQAAVYARLAAAHGDRDDAIAFIYSLDLVSDALREDGWEEAADARLGEAIAIAEGLAEHGDEEFSDMVLKAADAAPRRALELAAIFRAKASK